MNKKALSPVIATVLLISLVVVLAAIIFLWAKAFLPEQLEKGGSPIQDKCKEVNFIAVYGPEPGRVSVLNQGNIPIYGIKIGIKKALSLNYIEDQDFTTQLQIRAGEPKEFAIENSEDFPETGDELVIVPILLGKTSGRDVKAFVCDTEVAYTIES